MLFLFICFPLIKLEIHATNEFNFNFNFILFWLNAPDAAHKCREWQEVREYYWWYCDTRESLYSWLLLPLRHAWRNGSITTVYGKLLIIVSHSFHYNVYYRVIKIKISIYFFKEQQEQSSSRGDVIFSCWVCWLDPGLVVADEGKCLNGIERSHLWHYGLSKGTSSPYLLYTLFRSNPQVFFLFS